MADDKGKTEKKKSRGTQVHRLYAVSGSDLKRNNRSCPKCGPSVFMAKHKNRVACGKCGYTEFVNKE